VQLLERCVNQEMALLLWGMVCEREWQSSVVLEGTQLLCGGFGGSTANSTQLVTHAGFHTQQLRRSGRVCTATHSE
jgi:hypothetical protein